MARCTDGMDTAQGTLKATIHTHESFLRALDRGGQPSRIRHRAQKWEYAETRQIGRFAALYVPDPGAVDPVIAHDGFYDRVPTEPQIGAFGCSFDVGLPRTQPAAHDDLDVRCNAGKLKSLL